MWRVVDVINCPLLLSGREMYTIGQVAKKFSVSRSTLIYYDSIGVLSPSGRSSSNYRLYSESDIERMGKISLYRDAGLALESISSILDNQENDVSVTLEQRLITINSEIQSLRNQQKVILSILENTDSIRDSRVITKDIWVSLLKSAGLDEEGMMKWHIEFERMSPEAHQDFMESIGIENEEINMIRKWSRENREKI